MMLLMVKPRFQEMNSRRIVSGSGRVACPRCDWVAFSPGGGKPTFLTCAFLVLTDSLKQVLLHKKVQENFNDFK
jgi:hypothetical protein